ncbi:glycoside hydrolase family 43 protein [Flavobacterium flavipallidum]|uniref:Glycoside hydrolase family 43 protein n=1 Tax=Flavobacterium flavipallidum TaxID=3139140 RepID=A0ABU9HQ11_9FLAO
MKKNLFLILALQIVTVEVAVAQITITNPILSGFYPDPSIVKVDKDYYLVNSTFSYFPGIPVMYSKDLKNWKQIGNVIDRPSQMDFIGERLTRGLFAPAISYYKGLFYVTCTDIDNEGNFVVTAKDPAGPWSNPVKIPQVRGIDPSLFFDEETDKAYIVYNSDAPNNKPLYQGHRTVRIYEMDYKNLKVVGEETQLINGGVDITKEPVWIEGPHIMKKNGWYYLYAAEGGTSVNHSEVVLRSKVVTGPYEPYGKNPILTQRDLPANRKDPITSAGHAQFVEGPDGKDYAVFLAVRPYEGDYYNTGRETFIAPVKWVNEWPVINPDHKEIQYTQTFDFKEVKQKKVLPQSGNFKYTLKLNKQLDPSLLFMRTIDYNSFSISKKKGLVLKLKPETISEFTSPSFVGKRQQHINSNFETEMSFSPSSSNEKAGLVIVQDESHYYFLAKSKKDGRDVLQLFKSKDATTELLAEKFIEATSEKINLKISSNKDAYSFYFSENSKNWTLLKDDVDAKFLSTKVAGGFIGCLYGMYATSNGGKSSSSASFKHLTYSGNDSIYK